MANQKKSFNFRHGVQVDDDSFIVDTLGNVGIGSSIPSEFLDVGGNIRIRGTVFADEINTESLVNTGADGTSSFKLVNVGITSLTTGIITSSDPNGIVTYYGDARYLQGMPTSQWIDTDVGLGFTSIYNAGNVGVSTTDPRFSLQIGDTASDGTLISGVGINSVGNIDLTGTLKVGTAITANSGVITATKFVGSGAELTSLDAGQLTTGTIDTARIGNINISSGIITASKVKATTFTGDLVGIATTARDLTSDARITIDHIESTTSDLGVTTTTKLQANTLYTLTSVGIGTSTLNADLHLRKDGLADAQITSNDDRARLVIGRDTTAFGNNFIIETDNLEVTAYPEESGLNSVDIYNYAPGNLNFFIRPETEIDKKFNWINLSTSDTMMSLTQGGRLGIGKTNPDHDLHVVGTSTISSHTNIGGDFEVKGSTTLKGSLSGTSVSLSGIFRTSSRIGIALTANDIDPSYDFQVGYSLERVGLNTGAYITERGEGGFTGIVTAKKFSGIGSDLTDINPGNLSNGTVDVTSFHINTTSGIITAKEFHGDGSNLTDLNPGEFTSGNINVDNFSVQTSTGIITALEITGKGSRLTELDPGNISSGSIDQANFHINSTSGIITASEFVGGGTGITDLDAANITVGTFGSGNSSLDINITGVATANNFVGGGSNVTGLKPENVSAGIFNNSIFTKEIVAVGVTDGQSPDTPEKLSRQKILIYDRNATGYLQSSYLQSSIGYANTTVTSIAGISSELTKFELTSTDDLPNYDLEFRSVDAQILVVNGNKYQTSKVLVVHDSEGNIGIETYANVIINNSNNDIVKYTATYFSDVDDRILYLNAVPEPGISGLTTYKVTMSTLN